MHHFALRPFLVTAGRAALASLQICRKSSCIGFTSRHWSSH